MQRGIYALGGFLSRSKELRILWSPPLFTRHSQKEMGAGVFVARLVVRHLGFNTQITR